MNRARDRDDLALAAGQRVDGLFEVLKIDGHTV
jgi:hypothetical protein